MSECFECEPYDGKLSRTVLRAVSSDPYSLLGLCLIVQLVTGIFLAMHVRLLINNEPTHHCKSGLRVKVEFIPCKTASLPSIEMRRGPEHARKVLFIESYILEKRGELISIYDLNLR